MGEKSQRGNYFEDFSVGQELAHLGGRTVTEGDAAAYLSLTGDRNPLYCDAEFARAVGYRREVVNDLLVFHLVFGKSVPDISLNAVANLGYADVRFLGPVYAGDTLTSHSTVVGKRENKNGKSGIVYVQTHGVNQEGHPVLEFYRWVMVHKADASVEACEAIVPELAESVGVNRLQVDACLDLSGFSGGGPLLGAHFFEDYEVGERINHGAGMTIEEAEHASATRLYQNTAKVHFDGHAMESTPAGKRLIYGGHIISVAKAQAFNGLENALRILAWNGGTHANPTYGGDTIYSFSKVLDAQSMPGREDEGALRLRLVAVKNLDPTAESVEVMHHDSDKGRDVYHPNVVLDLDYWVAMPKRG